MEDEDVIMNHCEFSPPSSKFLRRDNIVLQKAMPVNTESSKNFSHVFDNFLFDKFEVSGEPVELTIECDFKTINVSGNYHRIYVVGICNVVNLWDSPNCVVFEGFTNKLNLLNRSSQDDAKCYVWGDFLSVSLNEAHGAVIYDNGPKPVKLPFPDPKYGQRHRLTYRPAEPFDEQLYIPRLVTTQSSQNQNRYDSLEEDSIDWEDDDTDSDMN